MHIAGLRCLRRCLRLARLTLLARGPVRATSRALARAPLHACTCHSHEGGTVARHWTRFMINLSAWSRASKSCAFAAATRDPIDCDPDIATVRRRPSMPDHAHGRRSMDVSTLEDVRRRVTGPTTLLFMLTCGTRRSDLSRGLGHMLMLTR